MRFRALLIVLLLGGCGQNASYVAKERLNAYDVEPASAAASRPQIAYTYSLTYALSDGTVAAVQARHIALCERLGIVRCHVTSSRVSGGPDSDGTSRGNAVLLIDARLATRFIANLDFIADSAGGHVMSRETASEDVTKQVVDTDARVRAKQALADRLLVLIRTSNGKVGDLVAAEKAFADTQEQLDAARAIQAELRQRVAMSQVDIVYSTSRSDDLFAPVSDSVRNAGASFAASLGALLTFVIVSLPWIVLFSIVGWVFRRTLWRRWRRRRERKRLEAGSATLQD